MGLVTPRLRWMVRQRDHDLFADGGGVAIEGVDGGVGIRGVFQ